MWFVKLSFPCYFFGVFSQFSNFFWFYQIFFSYHFWLEFFPIFPTCAIFQIFLFCQIVISLFFFFFRFFPHFSRLAAAASRFFKLLGFIRLSIVFYFFRLAATASRFFKKKWFVKLSFPCSIFWILIFFFDLRPLQEGATPTCDSSTDLRQNRWNAHLRQFTTKLRKNLHFSPFFSTWLQNFQSFFEISKNFPRNFEHSPFFWSCPCGKAPSPPRARGGAPFHRALRSLAVRETWLLGPVSPRIHASLLTSRLQADKTPW